MFGRRGTETGITSLIAILLINEGYLYVKYALPQILHVKHFS